MPRPNRIGSLAALMLALSSSAFAAEPAAVVQVVAPTQAQAATTLDASKAFTYQGMLRSAGAPLNATADLQFTLYDDAAAGTSFGTQSVSTTVSNGLFTVTLNDAGQFTATAFDGRALWISIAVRSPAGTGIYTTLAPRQALTAAPIASTLAPGAVVVAKETPYTSPGLRVVSPAETGLAAMWALEGVAGDPTFSVPKSVLAGVVGESADGYGVMGATRDGTGVYGKATGVGRAAVFVGNVRLFGKVEADNWQSLVAINGVGPLPLTSQTFVTHGGRLQLCYSGSGYSTASGVMIGMSVMLDGVTLVDNTGILANLVNQHLAFVPKSWVLNNVAAGSHTLTLTRLNTSTQTDAGDIFNVTVTELPF